jgi:hypothetical protein
VLTKVIDLSIWTPTIMKSKPTPLAGYLRKIAVILAMQFFTMALTTNSVADELDKVFETTSVKNAIGWLTIINRDTKLRTLFCTEHSLGVQGMKLVMQGRQDEGHPLVMKSVAIKEQLLRDYKIDILKLANAVGDAEKKTDQQSSKVVALYAKVHASCKAEASTQ